MPMLYLNVRHTLPMIGIRTQRNTLDTSIQQPRYEQQTQQARSNRSVVYVIYPPAAPIRYSL